MSIGCIICKWNPNKKTLLPICVLSAFLSPFCATNRKFGCNKPFFAAFHLSVPHYPLLSICSFQFVIPQVAADSFLPLSWNKVRRRLIFQHPAFFRLSSAIILLLPLINQCWHKRIFNGTTNNYVCVLMHHHSWIINRFSPSPHIHFHCFLPLFFFTPSDTCVATIPPFLWTVSVPKLPMSLSFPPKILSPSSNLLVLVGIS